MNVGSKPKRSIVGYMCKTDFDYELGEATDGNKIFPSVAELKMFNKCWKSCGIVKVETRLVKVVRKERL